ncbi:uncharacterized protein LTR77_003105 [Saxophila tyrrhenica]|uniref:Uncharacterized protein n=1 Tax=Saxophila tyrrhenica TaxID=1690608 RepID=A0AAV9PKY9_9PEZI|nr:hypothetical protein LTR77_003105 [Saxophila tyrrhenica]
MLICSTDTNVKPFKCFTCHMSFARRDLLQRHYTVHGKDQNQEPIPAANGMIPKSAGRTPIACSNCAKTKTKCDKKFPCSRCAGRNLKCTLRPTRRATKGAARVGGQPEGGGQVISADPGAQQNDSPPQQPPLLKPATPKNNGVPATPMADQAAPPMVDGPPSQFFDQPTSGPNGSAPGLAPAFVDASNGYPQGTPHDSYEDLSRLNKDESQMQSPQFMFDWNQMQMPMGYDGVVQPQMLVNQDMGFDPSMLQMAPPHPPPSADGMLSIMPNVANGTRPLITPTETPKVEQAFSHLGLANSNGAFQRHRRRHSLLSEGDVSGEMAQIVKARESWTVFRCTPTTPSASCPITAKLNLERLEQTLKDHEGWSTWSPQWEEPDPNDPNNKDYLTVMMLHESTRDKLLAITQSFLHKALEIHSEGTTTSPTQTHPSPRVSSNFVLLPPARVLLHFLRSYVNCSERYYPLTGRGNLDVNELMYFYNDRAASLLVLMMVAQGAMNIPSVEARMLTGGLTEACRISLFDLIEKNIVMSGNPVVLHAALLFTVQAAWSGDKWQMDIAMGQRGMYFAMLRHAGVLDQRPTSAAGMDGRPNTDRLWNEWIQNESQSRLVYSWIMVDQELALFHDTAPLFSVTEFGAPMPDSDRLWHAATAADWSSTFEQVHEFSGGFSSVGSGARPLSLRDLFQHFLDDQMIAMGIEMTPLQLRLLLHPLQGLVNQYSQLLSCFSDSFGQRSSSSRALTAASTRQSLGEVQALLQRWFDLAERYLKVNELCSMMSTNLVIFHLISLNAVTNFPEIERLARGENYDGSYQQLVLRHRRCVSDLEEAVYHCGQVFRLVKAMRPDVRPPWWAGAIYRAGLVLWVDSLINKDTMSPANNGMFPVAGPSILIDNEKPDSFLIVRYLTKREGTPALLRGDGTQVGIDQPYPILRHCIELIDRGASTRFSDGVRAKLDQLSRS